MSRSFETVTVGKWILAGEHAVLRGSAALVFPLSTAQLQFRYLPTTKANKDIDLQLSGKAGTELDLLFWGVLEKACALTGIRRSDLHGQFHLHNDIPVGAGLGASAAFCVAVSRWFSSQGAFGADKVEDFARELENLFHGESSGVDIAVAHLGRPMKFHRSGDRQFFTPAWQPHCYLSYSGQRGVTRECVGKVKDLSEAQPQQATAIDVKMKKSVEIAERALLAPESEGFSLLCQAMQMAGECFTEWGLFEGPVLRKAKDLLARGAQVVKPTGSGGGGYLLSLWSSPQSEPDLISCFK